METSKKAFYSRADLMSIKKKRFSRALPILAVILIFAAVCSAQEIEATIKIESVSPPVVRVDGRFLVRNNSKNWTFLRSIAGIENLGERISELKLEDKDGKEISYKKLMAGEYLAEGSATRFSYKVDLSAPKKLSGMAHVSWISDDQGLFMLGDLLPQFEWQFGGTVSADIRLELPEEWTAVPDERRPGKNSLVVHDVEHAVFFVGKNLRKIAGLVGKDKLIGKDWWGKHSVDILTSDEWLFSDDEALDIASEIVNEYENIFNRIPDRSAQIFLIKFPAGTKPGNWEAETRGSNVVILSSDMPFKNQSVQRLHEQLRHELFHLWIPNNLALTGNYDWFYEGFALYQSLRTGIGLNRIRFEDFLDTLARAYDLDSLQSGKLSLIEASKNRWSGSNAQIYARGMLVAFLCDVALLRTSKGKRSVSDILRLVYQKHQKPNKAEDANAAILNILETQVELRPIVERYIKGAEKIDWRVDLNSAGIQQSGENFPAKLTVKSKLSGRQKDLLDKLGYNNWRKLVPKSK
jgi:hypothetical protein